MPHLTSLKVVPVKPGEPLFPGVPDDGANPPDPSNEPPVSANLILPFKDPLPALAVLDLRSHGRDASCRIVLRRKIVKLHSSLPSTPVWSYDVKTKEGWLCPHQYLGPTIVVDRGQRAEVTYVNQLGGYLPVTTRYHDFGTAPDTAKEDAAISNAPGIADSDPYPHTIDRAKPVIYGAAVTHLHGGRTAAMYDGWTENVMLPPRDEIAVDADGHNQPPVRRNGQSQVSIYENEQPATMLWYHDHLMGATRYNVHAGLAAAYLIRDEDDPGLSPQAKGASVITAHGVELPAGDYEVPLVIQDRNLDGTDAETPMLNGKLLHKVTSNTAEFFGPYTLVNGVIWPKMQTERRRYRFRVLNGSNARTYCVKLVKVSFTSDGTVVLGDEIPLNNVARQIGTDGGMLPTPVTLPDGTPIPNSDSDPVPDEGLVLASAERADLIVDFARIHSSVTHVALVNTAFAPFHQFTVEQPDPSGKELDPNTNHPVQKGHPGKAVEGMRLKYPCVICFELKQAEAEDTTTDLIENPATLVDPATLGPSSHNDLKITDPGHTPLQHGHRLIMLKEYPAGMLTLCEMAEMTPGQFGQFTSTAYEGMIALQEPVHTPNGSQPGPSAYYAPVATRFEDRVAFFVPYGKVEVWKILNLTADTHPFHVHLVQFKLLGRTLFNQDAFDAGMGTTSMGGAITYQANGIVDENEKGWKDTVRVNPGEMVSIAARFDGFCGRYMYHCHILEHEDHEMMRPFIVLPGMAMELMPDMPMLDGTDGNMNSGAGPMKMG